jgi:hypothetical protein
MKDTDSPSSGDDQSARLRSEREFCVLLTLFDRSGTEVSGREHRKLKVDEEAELVALVEGRLDAPGRQRLMGFVAENGLALQRLAELLRAREQAPAGE